MNNERNLDDHTDQEVQKNNQGMKWEILKECGLLFIFSLTLSAFIFSICSTWNLGQSWVCYGGTVFPMMLMTTLVPFILTLFAVPAIISILLIIVFGSLVYLTKKKIINKKTKILLILGLYILFNVLNVLNMLVIGGQIWDRASSV